MLFSLAALALPSLVAAWGPEYVGALYQLTNGEEQGVIVSAIDKSGYTTFAQVVPTHGKGSGDRYNEVMGRDPLQAQGGIALQGDFMYVVNSGDGTISMFAIDEYDPTNIVQIGNNTASGGSYPVSIGVNPANDIVCVVNSGSMNGLQCFSASLSGLSTLGPFWSFGLNQTNPPVGPPNTPSDVIFSEDGTQMWVSVKGSGNASLPFQGYVWSYAIDGYNITQTGSFTPPGTPLAFSMTLFPNSSEMAGETSIFVTDPGTGGVNVISYDSTGNETYYANITLPGSGAPCWSAYDYVTDMFFAIDTGTSNVYMLQGAPMNLTLMNQINLNSTMGGNNFLTDVSILQTSWNQSYMYVNAEVDQSTYVFSLTPGAAPQMIQTYDVGKAVNGTGSWSLGPGLEGSAVYYKPEWLRMAGY